MPTKLNALLATGRISNLPTVWCNCLVAFLITAHLSPTLYFLSFKSSRATEFNLMIALSLIISSSLIYVGGCFLGDAADEKFDRQHKPTRPIPSGILNGKMIHLTAWIMLIGGAIIPNIARTFLNSEQIIISSMAGPSPFISLSVPTLALLLAVIFYSYFHKKSALLGLPLIGLCRLTLVTFAAGVVAWTTVSFIAYDGRSHYIPFLHKPLIIYAVAVLLFTISFASVARTESSDSPITWRNILRYTMLLLPLSTIIINPGTIAIPVAVAILIYALWMSHAFTFIDKNKGAFVSKCLAGFCLLDACFAAQFGWVWLVICLALFGVSLLLQKIAPAT